MKSKLPFIRLGVIVVCILSVSMLLVPAASALGTKGQSGCAQVGEVSAVEMLLARGAVSVGMTKKEVYDEKGVPDKTNRLPDEPGKEMWVYQCKNDEGFNEDCLHLYFDGDRLVKIDRL